MTCDEDDRYAIDRERCAMIILRAAEITAPFQHIERVEFRGEDIDAARDHRLECGILHETVRCCGAQDVKRTSIIQIDVVHTIIIHSAEVGRPLQITRDRETCREPIRSATDRRLVGRGIADQTGGRGEASDEHGTVHDRDRGGRLRAVGSEVGGPDLLIERVVQH